MKLDRYVIPSKPRTICTELLSEQDRTLLEYELADGHPDGEKPSLVRLKGQNKKRPPPMKFDASEQICASLIDVLENEEPQPCPYMPNCKYRHDIEVYMKERQPDLVPGGCYNYRTLGRCVRGLTCAFGEEHITPEGRNKINPNPTPEGKSVHINFLSKDLQTKLRKKKYNFEEAIKVVNANFRGNQEKKVEVPIVKPELSSDPLEPASKKVILSVSGPLTDEDVIAVRPAEKKKVFIIFMLCDTN